MMKWSKHVVMIMEFHGTMKYSLLSEEMLLLSKKKKNAFTEQVSFIFLSQKKEFSYQTKDAISSDKMPGLN